MLRKLREDFRQARTLITFTFMRGLGQVLGMIAPLVVAYYFLPDRFGSYSLARMIILFFSTLLISSSQIPFIIFANQEREETGRINRTFSVQCTFLVFGLFAFVVLTLLFGRYLKSFAAIDRGDLYFVLLAYIGLGLKLCLCNLFMALDERIRNAQVELVFGAVGLSLIVLLCILNKISLRTVFFVQFVSAVIVVLLFLRSIDYKLLLPLDLDIGHLRRIFDFTKWVVAGATAVYFVNWGDNLVLRYYVSMDEVGVYNLGYQLFKGLAILIPMLGSYFLPYLSRNINDSGKMRNYLYNKRPKIIAVVGTGILLVFLFAPLIFRLYSDAYAESVGVLRILILASAAILYSVFYDPILNVLKLYKFAQTINILQVLLNLALDIVLVPRMGMKGAAVATVIAYSFRTFIIEIYYRLKFKRLLGL